MGHLTGHSSSSAVDVACLLDQAAAAGASVQPMQDAGEYLHLGVPTTTAATPLGDGDLAQLLCQQLQLNMSDLNGQVHHELQLEELRARLALLTSSTPEPQLPVSSLPAQPASHGFPWGATTTAGSLSAPLCQLSEGALASEPLDNIRRCLSEALLLSTNSTAISSGINTPVLTSLGPTPISCAVQVPSMVPTVAEHLAVEGACVPPRVFSQPLPAASAALLDARIAACSSWNPYADPGMNPQVQHQLQLLFGSQAAVQGA
jgi:hypothetical protein